MGDSPSKHFLLFPISNLKIGMSGVPVCWHLSCQLATRLVATTSHTIFLAFPHVSRDYVHFIFEIWSTPDFATLLRKIKIWSTPDFNFPLAKFEIWSTPDFDFSKQSCKIWNTPDLRNIENLEYSRFSFFKSKIKNLGYSRF